MNVGIKFLILGAVAGILTVVLTSAEVEVDVIVFLLCYFTQNLVYMLEDV